MCYVITHFKSARCVFDFRTFSMIWNEFAECVP